MYGTVCCYKETQYGSISTAVCCVMCCHINPLCNTMSHQPWLLSPTTVSGTCTVKNLSLHFHIGAYLQAVTFPSYSHPRCVLAFCSTRTAHIRHVCAHLVVSCSSSSLHMHSGWLHVFKECITIVCPTTASLCNTPNHCISLCHQSTLLRASLHSYPTPSQLPARS